ncbi:hypothetical protein EV426DRAFT_176100 [Tirmania nivea]|nr:hypothetical protein EV426DRAFT_176100 [Tirmania nivea]
MRRPRSAPSRFGTLTEQREQYYHHAPNLSGCCGNLGPQNHWLGPQYPATLPPFASFLSSLLILSLFPLPTPTPPYLHLVASKFKAAISHLKPLRSRWQEQQDEVGDFFPSRLHDLRLHIRSRFEKNVLVKSSPAAILRATQHHTKSTFDWNF